MISLLWRQQKPEAREGIESEDVSASVFMYSRECAGKCKKKNLL